MHLPPRQLSAVCIALALLPWTLSYADESKSTAAFERGKSYYEKGAYKQARAELLKAIQENPKNTRAQQYLRHVQAAAKRGVKPKNLKATLETVTIRKVKFEELAVKKALAFISENVVKATGGQVRPNFILKTPTEATINLDLADLPASEVLRYVAELSGLKIQYDPHAVLLYKPSVAPPTKNAASSRQSKN